MQVIETLSRSAYIEPWAARAAGLVFAQYFWFRHCFLLTPEQGQSVQQLVVTMLSDKKLEVQDLAARSLSGNLMLISLIQIWVEALCSMLRAFNFLLSHGLVDLLILLRGYVQL